MTTGTSQNDLGRRHGIWIPASEIEAHVANGWSIADDTTAYARADNCVLMAPPKQEEGEAA